MSASASDSDSPLRCDPSQKAEREAANGVDQIDYLTYLVSDLSIREIRESFILKLHELAVEEIYPCGGKYRDAWRKVTISGSRHTPPHESLVPSLVSELVSRLNAERETWPALERAAYALWRLNWIHPFAGGNGRTSRALCYLILCADLEAMLPGVPTVPTLISEQRDAYLAALREADKGTDDDPKLETLVEYLQDLVTKQLASAISSLRNKR